MTSPPDEPAASRRVREEWRHRIAAEYGSAAITQHLTLWLIQIGASPDLVRDGLRVVDDELAHAELSHEVFVAAGGTTTAPLDRATLGLAETDERERDVVRTTLRVFCLGETVAVPLFRALRQGATVAVARRALDRILRDEVRHREFGWTTLAWLAEAGHEALIRAVATAELAAMFGELERAYGAALRGGLDRVSAAERAWGLATATEYAAILERTYGKDFRPRFARLGLDSDAAWAARLR